MQLELENVTYTYKSNSQGENWALKNISLKTVPGEALGIIGETGSGKSTLIQLFNGLLRPESGRVLFDGRDIWGKDFDLRQLRFNVGLVFQYPEYQLFEESIIKDVSFGPLNMGLNKEEAQDIAKRSLSLVGIGEELYDTSPLNISGGEKRRVAIAGVLAMNPGIFILDEPSAGLDPKGRQEIFDILKRIKKEKNITLIIVSHNMEEIGDIADRLVVMHKGAIALSGAPTEVLREKGLEQLGLESPVYIRLFDRLREKGINVSGNPLNLASAKDKIMQYMREKC